MDCAAWLKILFLEYSIISLAISTSLNVDSADVKFSAVLSKLEIVYSNLFCAAPKLALSDDTLFVASSITFIAVLA